MIFIAIPSDEIIVDGDGIRNGMGADIALNLRERALVSELRRVDAGFDPDGRARSVYPA